MHCFVGRAGPISRGFPGELDGLPKDLHNVIMKEEDSNELRDAQD